MAVRRVELRLVSTGFDETLKKLDELSLKLDKLKAKFDSLSKRVIAPRVRLDGADKADLQLDKLRVKLDEIGRKRVTAKVGVSMDKLALKKLLADLGGAGAGGGASAAGGGGGFGNIPWGPALIGAAIAYGLSLLPAVVPTLLGLGVGGGAGIGALAIGSKDNAQLTQLEQSLRGASGAQKAAIQAQIAAIKKNDAGFLSIYGSGKNLVGNLEKSFLGALTSQGSGGSKRVQHGGQTGFEDIVTPSFLQGFSGILSQIGGFVKTLGPGLGEMFRASLPFLSMFVQTMEYFAKLVMPIITQSMKDFAPYLPMMKAGFDALAQGIGYFIKDLGPGMKDSAIIFKATMIAVKGILIGIAYVADFLAHWFVRTAEAAKLLAMLLREWFDKARRWTAVAFDKMRHDIAHWVDDAKHDFDKITGDVMTWAHDFVHWFDVARHDTANVFDGIRHDIAHYWDMIWNNTIGRIQRGVKDVGTWFTNMKLKIGSVLSSLPGDLYNIGKNIIDHLVSGLKAAAGPLISFVNWVQGLISSIAGFFGIGGHSNGPSMPSMPTGVRAPALFLSPPASRASSAAPAALGEVHIYNITVQGDTDPDAAARRIHQRLRDYKKHRGNMALGLA